MTNLDLARLRELAEKADKISQGQTVAHCDSREWAEYIAATSPEKVIPMLNEIESLRHTLATCRDKNSQLENGEQTDGCHENVSLGN